MHFDEGKIKAYLDAELPSEEQSQVKKHLDACHYCQSKAQELLLRSHRVSGHLNGIAHIPSESTLSPRSARTRLDTYLSRKDNESMNKKLFAKKLQPLWIGLALVILLAVVISIPSIRVLANNFLGLFRVEQFTIVQVDPARISETLGESAGFEELLSRNVKFVENGEPQEVANSSQAAELAGFPLRLPASFKDNAQLMVTPATDISFQIDLKLIQGILDELDIQDVDLPKAVDGDTVSLAVPRGVTATYGECEFDPELAVKEGFDPDDIASMPLIRCTTFVQMPSPDVNAPPSLDIVKIGEAYLQLLGMDPEQAAQFSSHIDWTTTLVIPIPLYGTHYEEVHVDGVTGTLILSEGNTPQYLLMWVKDGMIYALTGPGNSTTALRTAATIE
jgi:hypothetical protein